MKSLLTGSSSAACRPRRSETGVWAKSTLQAINYTYMTELGVITLLHWANTATAEQQAMMATRISNYDGIIDRVTVNMFINEIEKEHV